MCVFQGKLKAYGAGLLGSFGELEYACAPYRPAGDTDATPEYRPWEPDRAACQQFPITSYQPVYFVAEVLCRPTLSSKNTSAKNTSLSYCSGRVLDFFVDCRAFVMRCLVDIIGEVWG